MAARQQLNEVYGCGAVLVAALVGLAAQSWWVFLAALAVLLGLCLAGGEIRPTPRQYR